MKKIFETFYIFSKFSLSFILLLSIFFLIYILYINYQNEDKVVKNQIELENELRVNINENTEFIKNISKEITETKTALISIEKTIKKNLNKDTNIDLSAINESIDKLNKNFNTLNSEISLIKNENSEIQSKNNPELVNQSINEIIELIKIKYENNLMFDKELIYLGKISGNNNDTALEKLSILKNNKYKGHTFLESQFKAEVDLYLKNIMIEDNNFINKILLPYISLSPSSENIIVDEKVLLLEEINFYIKNRKIEKAYLGLSKVERFEDFFQISSNEMKNYNNFIKELSRIK
ncbi:hypothetical protein OA855_02000 [Pelagibacteraceae bacterium]|nr:hypothetical protein [Pelagibacteraceae bacterium]